MSQVANLSAQFLSLRKFFGSMGLRPKCSYMGQCSLMWVRCGN